MNAGYRDLLAWLLAWKSDDAAVRTAVYRVAAAQVFVPGGVAQAFFS